ncbi:excinuclease ABC subunit C [Cytobacillus firmus]|uniref:excinuclease ABC subunit C n=1 Tax=Cytobacillus firmus TaxID=1399 RepID=UPI0018CDEFA4|nr:excinuclease ABC subunit C [Cytobacillus firmus]MBG9444030.1 excinuclease ABC subunit C [Cytobacillus firmus]
MESAIKKIDSIRNQVKQLIQENLHREVTPETKRTISGIYMIYVDNLTSEKIVPIYIGQAKDIQRRYKQHLSEILALNRLTYEEYHNYFFVKSFYEGNFKSCKIFKYMIENNCTLHDFHMIVLEEVEEEYLGEKEQEYFRRLLPSFFGFNQLNSFLKQLKFRFSNSQISDSEIKDYLSVLQDDIKFIYSYYEYGFTRFNLEYSMPKDISHLLKEKVQLDNDILLKFDEVKLSLNGLCERYITDFEETYSKYESFDVYKNAMGEYDKALYLLKMEAYEVLKELNIFDEEAFQNFIYSIVDDNNPNYKELFQAYLRSKKCEFNFYEIFDEQINDVNKKLVERDYKHAEYDVRVKREEERKRKRYQMIFPSCLFKAFSLKDRMNDFSIKINEEMDLLNTCHIQIYISNDGNSRSIEYDKEPFIIRLDYCYIDNEGNKTENEYYIDNGITRNCQSGIKYIEKDYYKWFVFKREKFKISSVKNGVMDDSFISIQAEYKHGINDYTLKDQELIKLSVVMDEIKQITDEETRFNIDVSESANCLKKCIMNEGLYKNEFVEQILLTKKLLKLKKRKKSPIKTAKEVVNKIDVTEK